MRVLAYLVLVVFFVAAAAWFARKRAGGKGKARGKAGCPVGWGGGACSPQDVQPEEKLVLRVDDDFLGGFAAAWSLKSSGYRVILLQDVFSAEDLVRRRGQELAAALLSLRLEPVERMAGLRSRLLSLGIPVLNLLPETPPFASESGRTGLFAGSVSSRASADELRVALARAIRSQFADGSAGAKNMYGDFDLKSEAV